MLKKPALLTAFGIGYILGARAGRERYDAIVGKAQDLWRDPRVQEKAEQAKLVAKEKADLAKETIKEKMPGGPGPTTPTSPTSKTVPDSATSTAWG